MFVDIWKIKERMLFKINKLNKNNDNKISYSSIVKIKSNLLLNPNILFLYFYKILSLFPFI